MRTKGGTPIAKNIGVLDENLRPSGKTYSRRAKQLVIKGRARWKDNFTIEMLPSSQSNEMEDISMDNKDIDVETTKEPRGSFCVV